MRKITLSLAIGMGLISMVTSTAFAQSSGEADPAQAKAPPTAPTTATERSAARDARKTTGKQAARGPQMGEGQSQPVAGPKVASADRKTAASQRQAANRAANKAGQFSRGGNNDAPERQKH